ncbi:hypothetical protein CSUI_005999, partial [Cystoisospora suis]
VIYEEEEEEDDGRGEKKRRAGARKRLGKETREVRGHLPPYQRYSFSYGRSCGNLSPSSSSSSSSSSFS